MTNLNGLVVPLKSFNTLTAFGFNLVTLNFQVVINTKPVNGGCKQTK